MGDKVSSGGHRGPIARADTERPDSRDGGRRSPTQPMSVGPVPSVELRAGSMVGDYRVIAKLAQGGMGTVYSGVHPIIGKRVAIKVIRRELGAVPEAADRFVQEARAVNQIGHPNIVDIFATGQLDDGRQYLVMERLEGETLADRLERGRMPAAESIDTLIQICAALEAAHERDVIHRDLKPDNVFLATEAGRTRVVLLDFGIAKLVSGAGLEEGLTTPGTMVGTPEYMSPEQARGESVDARTDIYSLGTIAYEMFLEGAPFSGPSPMDTIAAMLSNPPDMPSAVWPDIPSSLEKLLLAMIAKQRELRPTLDRVVRGLESARSELIARRNLGGVVRSRRESGGPRIGMTSGPIRLMTTAAMPTGTMSAQPRSRRRTIAALVGALAIVVAAIAVVASRDDGTGSVAASTEPVDSSPAAGGIEPAAPLDPTTGIVVLTVNADRPQVTIDGEPAIVAAGDPSIELLAGAHTIEVAADGFVAETQTVTVEAGGTLVLDIELERSAPSHTVPKHKRDGDEREVEAKKAKTRIENTRGRKKPRPASGPRFDTDGTIDPFSRK